jgi:hypothetical protein
MPPLPPEEYHERIRYKTRWGWHLGEAEELWQVREGKGKECLVRGACFTLTGREGRRER